ncbi:MAG: hypothetical protein EP349_09835 [Alphaproteobacteria bacterium]|nr:MAG: hypothetical protein EP349_09835 [Alphaproteobacteria bacterium]
MTDIRDTFSKRMGEMIADVMGADAIKDMYEKGDLTEEQKKKPSGFLALDLGIVTAGAKDALLIAQAAERTLQTIERVEAALDKAPELAASIRKDMDTVHTHNSWLGTVSRFVTRQPKPEIADKIKTWSDYNTHLKERFDEECGFLPCDDKEFAHLGLSAMAEPHFSIVAIIGPNADAPEQKKTEAMKPEDVDAVKLAQTINYLARQEEVMTKNSVFWSFSNRLSEFSGKERKEIASYHQPRHEGLKEIANHLYHMAAGMLEKEGYPDVAKQIRNDETIQNAAGNTLGKTRDEQFEAYAGSPGKIINSAYEEYKANDDQITNYAGWGTSRGYSATSMMELFNLSTIMEAMPGILQGAGCITATEAANMSANTKSALPNKDNIQARINEFSSDPWTGDGSKPEAGKNRIVRVEV